MFFEKIFKRAEASQKSEEMQTDGPDIISVEEQLEVEPITSPEQEPCELSVPGENATCDEGEAPELEEKDATITIEANEGGEDSMADIQPEETAKSEETVMPEAETSVMPEADLSSDSVQQEEPVVETPVVENVAVEEKADEEANEEEAAVTDGTGEEEGTTETPDKKEPEAEDLVSEQPIEEQESTDALQDDSADDANLARIRMYTNEDDVIGMSFRGEGHIRQNTPCQDAHSYKKINEAWGLAIVSDGAGSAAHSDMGSEAVCSAFTHYMTGFLAQYSDGTIPDAKTWDIEFRGMLCNFQRDLAKLAEYRKVEYKSLAATIILLAYSSKGYVYAHVGDGRAAVKTGDDWNAIITPHKGEEANQTIFSTSINYGERPNLKLSGVYVPETGVSTEPINQFVLMSDGLENGLWHTSKRVELPDGDFRWESQNMPFVKGIEAFMDLLNLAEEEREVPLMNHVISFNRSILKEPDDKTILIGKM